MKFTVSVLGGKSKGAKQKIAEITADRYEEDIPSYAHLTFYATEDTFWSKTESLVASIVITGPYVVEQV